jgi:hypothetical protein
MRVARVRRGLTLQFPRCAEFDITGRSIRCRPSPAAGRRTIRHLLLDQVLPAVVARGKRLVLHASAVAIDGRAIAFVGPSGAGKSTTAAALVRQGATTIADDALVLRPGGAASATMSAIPTYPGLRLWPDARGVVGRWRGVRTQPVTDDHCKQRWFGRAVPFTDRILPLSAVYLLERGPTLELSGVQPQHAMIAFVRASMVLDPTDRAAMQRGFELSSALAERAPVLRLIVPPRPAAVAAACAAILKIH